MGFGTLLDLTSADAEMKTLWGSNYFMGSMFGLEMKDHLSPRGGVVANSTIEDAE